MSDFELAKTLVEAAGLIDKLVVLKHDDKGYYIEYAFKEGAPHDNRCLSWYDSYQEAAYIRNKWLEKCPTEEAKQQRLASLKKIIDDKLGKIFYLGSFTCGGEEDPDGQIKRHKEDWEKFHEGEEFIPENHVCKVGSPCKNCGITCKWSKEEPVKCACWHLGNEFKEEDAIYNLNVAKIKEIFSKLKSENYG